MSGFSDNNYGIRSQDLTVKSSQHFPPPGPPPDLCYVNSVQHGYTDIRRGFFDNYNLLSRTDLSRGAGLPDTGGGDVSSFHQRVHQSLAMTDIRAIGAGGFHGGGEPLNILQYMPDLGYLDRQQQAVLHRLHADTRQQQEGSSRSTLAEVQKEADPCPRTTEEARALKLEAESFKGKDLVEEYQEEDDEDEEDEEDRSSESDLGEMICIEPELGYIKHDTDNEDSKTSGAEELGTPHQDKKAPPVGEDVSTETASFKCIGCNLYFAKKTALYLHKRKVHNPKFLCEDCEFATGEVSSLKKHKLSVHDKVKHPCDQCDFQASCTTVLREHKLTQHVKIKHPCNLCSFVTYGKRNLKRHIMKMHEGCVPNTVYKCDQCDFSAQFAFSLKEHREIEHEGKSFACDADQCVFKTMVRQELLDHRDVHQGSKHGLTLYPCDQCDYSTSLRVHLNSHKKSHHGQTKLAKHFPCDQCDYVGTYKCNLTSHIKSQHEGIKSTRSFPCDQCSYVATYRSNLKAHAKSRHQGIRSDKVFPCTQCPYVSSYKSNLNSHIKSQHEGIKSSNEYRCDKCDYVGSYKCNLNEHKKRKHGVARQEAGTHSSLSFPPDSSGNLNL